MPNPWQTIEQFGQSLWYDNLSRGFISEGGLEKMISELDLRGVTSNPSIFEKAIAGGSEYDESIAELVRDGRSTKEIYDVLTTDDIRAACDVMRTVYDRTNGIDGYVSLEVDPYLAYDTEGSLASARELWETVSRPNLMIKIPGTTEGIVAVRTLLTEGINVNITLLFGIENYSAVAKAYIDALNARKAEGETIEDIASVASFFLSRVDVKIDAKLQSMIDATENESTKEEYRSLLGLAGVANAKVAYERYLDIFSDESFRVLTGVGAKVQRCLWASVSTKNPSYNDVMYIEPLIGPDTVTTVPDETIAAFSDHGVADNTLESGILEAHQTLDRLKDIGIDSEKVAEELQKEGVQKFIDAFDGLASKMDAKRKSIESAMA